MKFMINRVMVAFLLVTLAGAAAFAKSNTGTVSFSSNIKVNGTLVKKGYYYVRFDEKTGELTFAKDGKVVAKAAARLEKRFRKAGGNEAQTSPAGMEQRLVAITFSGSSQNIVLNQDGMQAAGN
jgi:endonuclease YncB( thermonuclease family)